MRILAFDKKKFMSAQVFTVKPGLTATSCSNRLMSAQGSALKIRGLASVEIKYINEKLVFFPSKAPTVVWNFTEQPC